MKVHTFNNQNGARLEFEYTKLILAQGGRPIKPNLPGAMAIMCFLYGRWMIWIKSPVI